MGTLRRPKPLADADLIANLEVPLDQLTDRELSVLQLVADGLTNEAIGVRLHISVKTVEALMASIFRHLGLVESCDVNRRVTAAVTYVRSIR